MAVASPLFRTLPLETYGLEWVHSPAAIAHPFDDGDAAFVYRSIDSSAARLGADASHYRNLMSPLLEAWPRIDEAVLGPFGWPPHPFAFARFGLKALQSAHTIARRHFTQERTRALFAGIAAHCMLPLDHRPAGGAGLVLNLMAHVAGWPMPKGGAQSLADALARYLRSLGGEIVTGTPITSFDDLPKAKAILCDLSPRPLLRIAGHRFPAGYRRALERYRYGMGTFKVDWALDGPIPWKNPEVATAATVHLGGSLGEIASAEAAAWNGRRTDRPFVLLSQPTLFDATRAPAGRHVAWTYCHVPHGSDADMLPAIERQIERFAPGFGDRVLARAVMRPADIERHNPNMAGGDIGSGMMDLGQLFTRPTWRTYSTPVRGLYICSASTPPGVSVHGMCGYHAAHRALREVLRD